MMRISKCKKCKHSKLLKNFDGTQELYCQPGLCYWHKFYTSPCKERYFKDCFIIRKTKATKMTKQQFIEMYFSFYDKGDVFFDEIYQLAKQEGFIIDEMTGKQLTEQKNMVIKRILLKLVKFRMKS